MGSQIEPIFASIQFVGGTGSGSVHPPDENGVQHIYARTGVLLAFNVWVDRHKGQNVPDSTTWEVDGVAGGLEVPPNYPDGWKAYVTTDGAVGQTGTVTATTHFGADSGSVSAVVTIIE